MLVVFVVIAAGCQPGFVRQRRARQGAVVVGNVALLTAKCDRAYSLARGREMAQGFYTWVGKQNQTKLSRDTEQQPVPRPNAYTQKEETRVLSVGLRGNPGC